MSQFEYITIKERLTMVCRYLEIFVSSIVFGFCLCSFLLFFFVLVPLVPVCWRFFPFLFFFPKLESEYNLRSSSDSTLLSYPNIKPKATLGERAFLTVCHT